MVMMILFLSFWIKKFQALDYFHDHFFFALALAILFIPLLIFLIFHFVFYIFLSLFFFFVIILMFFKVVYFVRGPRRKGGPVFNC